MDKYKFILQFKLKKDHSELFTKSLNRKSQQYKAFVFIILNWSEEGYQQFNCPMVFSNVSYNWCVTGANKLVGIFKK